MDLEPVSDPELNRLEVSVHAYDFLLSAFTNFMSFCLEQFLVEGSTFAMTDYIHSE